MDNKEYYSTRPVERLERCVEGLGGIIELLQAVCSGQNSLNDVSPGSFSSLLEIVKDDMECSVSDYYIRKKVFASQEPCDDISIADDAPTNHRTFKKDVHNYVDSYFDNNSVPEAFFEEFGERPHNE